MDATDALAVLRQQYADLEEEALTSGDRHLSIAIGIQQDEIRHRVQLLEDNLYAIDIAQEDIGTQDLIHSICTDERQLVAQQGDWGFDLASLEVQLRPIQEGYLELPGEYLRAVRKPLLISDEDFLSAEPGRHQLGSALQNSMIPQLSPIDLPRWGNNDAAWSSETAWDSKGFEQATATTSDRAMGLAPRNTTAEGGPWTALDNIDACTPTEQPSLDERLATTNLDHKACTACTDDIMPMRRLDLTCGHCYCEACLLFMIRMATEDITRWPARCCGIITASDIARLLPDDLQARYAVRSMEWAAEDPTYCHDPACECFLVQPAGVKIGVLKCRKCSAGTCTHCKQAEHKGGCVKEVLPDDLAQLAQEEEWQRCPKCERMVGLHHGCNHITCHCKTEWCYDCATVWKNCTCPQWREDRLLNRAARAAVRGATHFDPEIAVRGFRELIEQIREAGATCNHESLRRVNKSGVCDDCGQFLDIYLYRGCRCRLEICLWCRDTRQGLLRLREPREITLWIKHRNSGGKMLRRNYTYRGAANGQRLSEAAGTQRAERLLEETVEARNANRQRLVEAEQQEALLRRFAAIENTAEDAWE